MNTGFRQQYLVDFRTNFLTGFLVIVYSLCGFYLVNIKFSVVPNFPFVSFLGRDKHTTVIKLNMEILNGADKAPYSRLIFVFGGRGVVQFYLGCKLHLNLGNKFSSKSSLIIFKNFPKENLEP